MYIAIVTTKTGDHRLSNSIAFREFLTKDELVDFLTGPKSSIQSIRVFEATELEYTVDVNMKEKTRST